MKKLLILILVTILSITPTACFANETTQLQSPNDWAAKDLYQAEVAMILPSDWQTSLHNPLSSKHATYIRKGLERKFELAGMKKIEEKLLGTPQTRGQVLNFYLEILKQYELDNLDRNVDSITYMQNAGIIQGNDEGDLKLEKECTLQDTVVFANRFLNHVYSLRNSGSKGFLWEVSDEDNKVYLLGTIHIGKEVIYPFNETLNTCIDNIDTLSFEVDFYDQEGMAYLQQKQVYLDGTTVKDHISPELYEKTIKAFEKFGVAEESIKQYKPWVLANTLISLGAMDLEASATGQVQVLPAIDMYVYNNGLIQGKEIIEIEGYKYQSDLLDGVDFEIQLEQLESAIRMIMEETTEESEEGLKQIEDWLQYFHEGNEDKFAESYPKDNELEVEDKMTKILFDERDDHMSKMVLEYLADTDKDYLVVVGAGHMIGKKGIVQQIIDAGYEVKQVE